MTPLRNTQEESADNRATAALAETLDQKRGALEQAVADAPHGRHMEEWAAMEAAHEQLARSADPAERVKLEEFCERQHKQLAEIQRTEVDLVNAVLQMIGAEKYSPAEQLEQLEFLKRAVEEIGDFHDAEHERLARERSELEAALAVTDADRRGELIDELRQRQDEAGKRLDETTERLRLDSAFAEGPGKTWTAEEQEMRLEAGKSDQLRRDPGAFVREQGWKLPSRVLDDALEKAVSDAAERRALSDLAAEIKDKAERMEGPQRRPELRYEEAERAGIRPAPRSRDEADVDNRHARGNLGERSAAEWLAAAGYEVLSYKPDIKDTTKSGIDLLAMKGNTAYLVDNKALSRAGNVRDVSALTTNFDRNLSEAKDALRKMAADADRPTKEVALVQKALYALEQRRYVRAVTNANVARDQKLLTDVSERLKTQHKIEFIDVMRRREEDELHST
jgi:hypothetical protein